MCLYLSLSALYVSDSLVHHQERRCLKLYRSWYKPVPYNWLLCTAIHYCPNIDIAFKRVRHICRDVNYGWLLRTLHANGASLFFVCIYLHTGQNIYNGSYNFTHTWSVAVLILFLTIATAFLGYVLPWGQISFWGATVIRNLLSAIPYIGKEVVRRVSRK